MTKLTIPAIGSFIEGGYFHGILLIGGQLWGEVTAPKAAGEISGHVWHPKHQEISGAASDFDGLANTVAMAEAGSPLAQHARELRIGGFDDWYIPARGGQLLQWGNLTPLLAEAEQFAPAWYWSSTQFSRGDAYGQYFGYGYTLNYGKSWGGGRARAVRRFQLGDVAWHDNPHPSVTAAPAQPRSFARLYEEHAEGIAHEGARMAMEQWHAEAMRLADKYVYDDDWKDAREALAAHLRAVPQAGDFAPCAFEPQAAGEPVGECRDDIERCDVLWFVPRLPHGTPLYAAPTAPAQPDDGVLGTPEASDGGPKK